MLLQIGLLLLITTIISSCTWYVESTTDPHLYKHFVDCFFTIAKIFNFSLIVKSDISLRVREGNADCLFEVENTEVIVQFEKQVYVVPCTFQWVWCETDGWYQYDAFST